MESNLVVLSDTKEDDGCFRLDSDHYKKEYIYVKKKLIDFGSKPLNELITATVKTGHTPSKKRSEYYNGPINFIKTDNLRQFKITHNFSDTLTELGNNTIKRSSLREKDVIVSIIGATKEIVGRACLIQKEDLPANINQNIALIRVSKKIFPEFLVVYLNTYFGRNYLWHLSRQTEQVNLNCREIEKILVPIFGKNLQRQIKSVYEKSYDLMIQSKKLFEQSKKILISELALNDWELKNKKSFIKKYSDSKKANRVDSEFFQPKYYQLIEQIKKYYNGYDDLNNIIKIRDNRFLPIDDEYYEYIELSNIKSHGEIENVETNLGKELPKRARRKVKAGDVIIPSVEGSLSSVALITSKYNKAICSNGFYVISSDTINPESLLVLMKSFVCQEQLKRGCSGTILTAINKNELDKIIIPKISNDLQLEIKEKIGNMYDCREKSKKLLNVAIEGIEIAITKNEEEAEKWMEKNYRDIIPNIIR